MHGWVIGGFCDCVCQWFVCPLSKRKTAWAINTKLGPSSCWRGYAHRYNCFDFL